MTNATLGSRERDVTTDSANEIFNVFEDRQGDTIRKSTDKYR